MFRASRSVLASILVLLPALASGCRAEQPPGGAAQAQGVPDMAIQVTSSAFDHDQTIPKKYTGEGTDVSPPLEWSNVPAGTQEFALIVNDPDAPVGDWVHWVIYKIPADVKALPEAVPPEPGAARPAGALQGKNSWRSGRTIGYRGPMPPPGKPHRYHFTVYALSAKLEAEPGLEREALLRLMEGNVLGEGRLTGIYQR